jgi:ribonuclease P protein component
VSGAERSLKSRYRLRPSNRVRKAADYQAVFAAAKRSADDFFTILYRPSESSAARLGFAISAKRIRTAVARNRLRRLIRETFRMAQGRLAGLDVVVLAREQAARADNATVRESLRQHWSRLAEAGHRKPARA